MARFNFTEISLQSKADITEVMNNFNKIDALGITNEEVTNQINAVKSEINTSVDSKVSASATAINTATDNKLKNYTPSADLGSLATANYSFGTAAPTGGSDGDIYDQYF